MKHSTSLHVIMILVLNICINHSFAQYGDNVGFINLQDSADNENPVIIQNKNFINGGISQHEFGPLLIKSEVQLNSDTLRKVKLNWVNFSKGLSINYLFLKSDIELSHCKVGADDHKASLMIGESEFGKAIFDETTFKEKVSVSFSKFNNNVSFQGCVFNSSLSLGGVYFAHKLILSHLELTDSSKIIIGTCILPDTLDFSNNPIIPNEIDLKNASFKNDSIQKLCHINLYNSDISKFRLNYFNFRLDLSNAGKPISLEESKAIYESLLENFKVHNQKESYQALNIEYQDFKIKTRPLIKYFWWLPHYWNCYGYNKEWVFGWTGMFLIVFTIISFLKFKRLNDSENGVYPISNIQSTPSNYFDKINKSRVQKFLDRLFYSFVWTSCVFFLLKLDIKNIKFSNKLGVFYLIVVYSAGIVCLAYMAGYVITR